MHTNNIDINNNTVLITGSSGFVGSNLVMELIRTVPEVHIVGLDNMNDYYDVWSNVNKVDRKKLRTK